jgi:2-polyprenyl-3-methyl-5-hydroxy-6-metoxy-1,4-benzoquinol methylase
MDSSDINYKAYGEHADVYLEKNHDGITGGLKPQERVRNFKRYLKNGTVLEIGSGQGLDALELQNQGFDITPTDFVDSFIEILKSKKLFPIKVNLKTDTLDRFHQLQGVYANAVFVHFSPEDFASALRKINTVLHSNGYLFFSVLQGEGSEISNRMSGVEREFYYYTSKELYQLLSVSGFTVDELNEPIDNRWIHVICHKD